jgi:hypothetical protein
MMGRLNHHQKQLFYSFRLDEVGANYCRVSMSAEALICEFPGERLPVDAAEFVGDRLLVRAGGGQHSAAWKSINELVQLGGFEPPTS